MLARDLPALARVASQLAFSPPAKIIKEEARIIGELAELNAFQGTSAWKTGAGVPHGHGEPVAVLQGFMERHVDMKHLTHWLRVIGYKPVLVGPKINIHSITNSLKKAEMDISNIVAGYGAPIAAIGHSLGGTQHVLISHGNPGLFRHIITLDSPISLPLKVAPEIAALALPVRLANSLALGLREMQEALTGCSGAERGTARMIASAGSILHGLILGSHEELEALKALERGLSVPVTAYHGTGGVVGSSSTTRPDAKETVETGATHLGHIIKPSVFLQLAQTLDSLHRGDA
ncbi:MAG: hypothetical protein M1354_00720 [Candidatus Marsarchaeota archaeon]|jgi:pimeloyl-ACP methyl ester carboxylesterase|nr:hypothetical protein [Candidatus Marsarchaeota archaeon]